LKFFDQILVFLSLLEEYLQRAKLILEAPELEVVPTYFAVLALWVRVITVEPWEARSLALWPKQKRILCIRTVGRETEN
jgi:hypothetical protein